jgi:DNA-binding LytR/AlgR family response regulator
MPDLRAVVIDDEVPAVRRLCRSLESVDGIEIVGATSKATESVELIERLSPDIIFIDIAMPKLSGLEVVDRVSGRKMAVVFVTAHHEHAAAAFEIDAADYLLKPVSQVRLQRAIKRSRRWLQGVAGEKVITGDKSVWVYTNREFVRIAINRIEWIEAQGNYVWVHAGEQGGMLRTTITAIEEWLDPSQFIRVHRSVICRADLILAISRRSTGALQAKLTDGSRVPVGRTYVAGLRRLLKLLASKNHKIGG